MIGSKKENLINDLISKLKDVSGVDTLYFLNSNFELIKEYKNTDSPNYLQQIKSIIEAKQSFETNATEFNTITLLSENGLIIVSKINSDETFFLVIVAGENEPADLLNLLKICKEPHVVI